MTSQAQDTRRAAERTPRKLETRLTPGEKSSHKRLAQWATVYSIAPFPRTAGAIMHTLHDGLPIATGVIEGACRYLAEDRMARAGARWSLTGAEAVPPGLRGVGVLGR